MDYIPTARDVLSNRVILPEGVKLQSLKTLDDSRGSLTEIFRDEWGLGPRPLQWNVVRSEANVLRGVHAHRSHIDYLAMISGEMVLCLHDLRPSSPTHRRSLLLRLQGHDLHLAVVPVGVAHGFYFPEAACLVYSVSHYFDGADEFGCRWDDPDLAVAWPCQDPLLSPRDRTAGSYDEMNVALGL